MEKKYKSSMAIDPAKTKQAAISNSDDITHRRLIHRELKGKVKKYGNREFIYFKDQVIGFRDLDLESDKAAAGLSNLGVCKGDKVAIIMNNRPEYLFLWFGLSKLGAVEVPINTAHKGNLLTYMIDQADCRFLVVESCYLDRVGPVLKDLPKLEKVIVLKGSVEDLPQLDKPVIDYEKVVENDGKYNEIEVLWSDPFAIMFTSGTTGPSKGVVLPQNYALCGAESTIDIVQYNESDCYYNPLPLFHLASQLGGTLTCLMSGARMVLEERFSASRFWEDIKRYKCTISFFIGGVLSILMKTDPKPEDKDHSLKIMAGPNAPKEIFKAVEERFGVILLDNYGTSEIGICTISSPQNRKPGSCGFSRQDYSMKIVDDNDMEVGSYTTGEVVVRPEKPFAGFLGYYKMAEQTVEAWRNGWFHTGDYMYCDEDGFFYFVDRKKDALRRRGENISSTEVEAIVGAHPAVLEVAAIAAKSEVGEDEVMVCVMPKPGEIIKPEELISYCESRMAYFMVPRFIRFVDKIPKTPSERAQKYKLREEGVTGDTWDREKAGYKLKR